MFLPSLQALHPLQLPRSSLMPTTSWLSRDASILASCKMNQIKVSQIGPAFSISRSSKCSCWQFIVHLITAWHNV